MGVVLTTPAGASPFGPAMRSANCRLSQQAFGVAPARSARRPRTRPGSGHGCGPAPRSTAGAPPRHSATPRGAAMARATGRHQGGAISSRPQPPCTTSRRSVSAVGPMMPKERRRPLSTSLAHPLGRRTRLARPTAAQQQPGAPVTVRGKLVGAGPHRPRELQRRQVGRGQARQRGAALRLGQCGKEGGEVAHPAALRPLAPGTSRKRELRSPTWRRSSRASRAAPCPNPRPARRRS